MEQAVAITLGLDLGNFSPAAKTAEKALTGIGTAGQTSARQISAATRQLPAQFTDIATSLAGGQNPFLVLLQQGGQIRDSFGGIGAAIRGIGSLISPATVAIGAAAAGLGTIATAATLGARESIAFRDTLLLTGNAAGLTASRFDELSSRVASSTQQTIGGAREIVNALAATGQTSATIIEGQAKAIARISDLSGKSGAEVAKGFAAQLDAPAKFAAQLNTAYNFLNVAQFRRIQQLEKEGKEAQAVTLTNDLLLKALDKQKQNLGTLESAWDGVRKAASGAWDSMLSIGRADSTAEKISKIRKEIDGIVKASGGKEPSAGNASSLRIQGLRSQLQLLAEQAKQESAVAQKASEDAAKNREGIDAALKTGGKAGDPLSAIRDARQAQKADFLRSEKAYYEDIAAEDRRLFEQGLKDPLGEFITERVLPDDTKRGQQRVDSQTQILQDLVDANDRAGAELLAGERERGLALIELDRSIALRRLAQAQLTGEVLAQAVAEVNDRAALSQIALDQQITDKLQRGADKVSDALTQSISEGALEGFRRGGSFADVFAAELKSQFAKIVLTPLIRPQVEAGNNILQSLLGGVANLFSPSAAGLSVPAADFATGDIIRGRRAAGGPVAAGSTYLVGEQGPELLRMGAQGGTVIPNHAMGAPITVTSSPTIMIDARSDQAQVAQIVSAALAENTRRIYEDLRARRAIG